VEGAREFEKVGREEIRAEVIEDDSDIIAEAGEHADEVDLGGLGEF